MALQSNFRSDLKKEQQLSVLLDTYYGSFLKRYTVDRVTDIRNQLAGADLFFTHKTSNRTYTIDEKAQLDYVNEDLPTFAFEISYRKKEVLKEGWLFDISKKTDFYALATSIYQDVPEAYTSCKITFVNRKKLIRLLKQRHVDRTVLGEYIKKNKNTQGKLPLTELEHGSEGYLYFSRANKAEQPINLILRLDFLIASGIAKRFV